MNPTGIYSLTLVPDGQGTMTRATPSGSGATSSYLPLGATFTDAFRKNRAPTSAELIQQLIGIPYACAGLNAESVAGVPLRVYLRTRKGERKSKLSEAGRTKGIDARTAKRLKRNAPAMVSGDDQIEEVVDHPLLVHLTKPAAELGEPTLGAHDRLFLTQLYLETIGRAYWHVETDGFGDPVKYTLLRSHLVREMPDYKAGKPIAFYQYGDHTLSLDEVRKFVFPDPNNPYVGGYSPLQAAIEQVRLMRKTDAHTNALLDNMGRPDAVWSPKGDSEGSSIGSAEATRMRLAFQQAFARAGRGGVMVSEFPGVIEPLQWAPGDIVELDRAKQIKTTICNVFGVPDAKLERNAANLASAQTADYAHAKDAIQPRCKRLAEAMNTFIVPMYDDTGRLFVAFDSAIPEDEQQEIKNLESGVRIGGVTRNEYRESINKPPMDGGDVPLVDGGLVAVGEDGKPIKPLGAPLAQSTVDKDLADTQRKIADALTALAAGNSAETIDAKRIARRAQKKLRKVEKELKETKDAVRISNEGGERTPERAARAAVHESSIHGSNEGRDNPYVQPEKRNSEGADAAGRVCEDGTQDAAQTKAIGRIGSDGTAGAIPEGHDLALAISGYFERQERAAISLAGTKSIEGAETKADEPIVWPAIDSIFDDSDELAGILAMFLLLSASKAVNDIADSAELPPKVKSAVLGRLPAILAAGVTACAVSVNGTTKTQLQAAIDEVRIQYEAGAITNRGTALTEAIKRLFETAANDRAAIIAAQETSRAIHLAELEVISVSAIQFKKKWLANAGACALCLANMDKGYVDLDFIYGVTDYGEVKVPPDQHCRCECTAIYERADKLPKGSH